MRARQKHASEIFAEPQYYAASNRRKTMDRKDLLFLTNQLNITEYAFALSEGNQHEQRHELADLFGLGAQG